MKKKSKIDFYVVEYLYPKSYKRFIQKMYPNTGIVSNISLAMFEQKNMYGFFDREGIFLTTEIVGSEAQWMYTIHFNGVIISNNTSRASREEIEVDGFFKCFEYLEKQLQETCLRDGQ